MGWLPDSIATNTTSPTITVAGVTIANPDYVPPVQNASLSDVLSKYNATPEQLAWYWNITPEQAQQGLNALSADQLNTLQNATDPLATMGGTTNYYQNLLDSTYANTLKSIGINPTYNAHPSGWGDFFSAMAPIASVLAPAVLGATGMFGEAIPTADAFEQAALGTGLTPSTGLSAAADSLGYLGPPSSLAGAADAAGALDAAGAAGAASGAGAAETGLSTFKPYTSQLSDLLNAPTVPGGSATSALPLSQGYSATQSLANLASQVTPDLASVASTGYQFTPTLSTLAAAGATGLPSTIGQLASLTTPALQSVGTTGYQFSPTQATIDAASTPTTTTWYDKLLNAIKANPTSAVKLATALAGGGAAMPSGTIGGGGGSGFSGPVDNFATPGMTGSVGSTGSSPKLATELQSPQLEFTPYTPGKLAPLAIGATDLTPITNVANAAGATWNGKLARALQGMS